MKLSVIQGDITTLAVDIIVNAANASLLKGAGVCGAIHNAAGPDLQEACKALQGCDTGQAKITPGFDLIAKHVIHTVGPIWNGGQDNEAELLGFCYRNALMLAEQEKAHSIAFPAISCGIYGYPLEQACQVSVETILGISEYLQTLQDVYLVAFDLATKEAWEKAVTSQVA